MTSTLARQTHSTVRPSGTVSPHGARGRGGNRKVREEMMAGSFPNLISTLKVMLIRK